MSKIALTVSVLSALSQYAFAGPIRVLDVNPPGPSVTTVLDTNPPGPSVISALDTKAAPDSSVVRVLDTNFADPSVIKTDDGYYSFATVGGGVHAQVATSKDFKEWKRLDGHDAVPGPFPDWIAKVPAIWAPDVIKRDDGKYVMYFSAAPKKSDKQHCIAVGLSSSPEGPYTPEDSPLACNLDQGGSIDPSGFQDADGTRYVVYKIDGNSKAHPSTPLMLQALKSDGVTPDGKPKQLLDRDESDGPLVEAPSIVLRDGTYYLTYSSHMFNTENYDVRYATASSVTGPYTKAKGQLLKTGDLTGAGGKLVAPGGSDFSEDGKKIVFHAFKNNTAGIHGGRAMFTADISLSKGKITIN